VLLNVSVLEDFVGYRITTESRTLKIETVDFIEVTDVKVVPNLTV
jgi:hypothetical protein